MEDFRRKKLEEQYEELALSLLMDDYADEEGARLLLEFEAAELREELPEIPVELDQKCQQLIRNSIVKQARKSKIIRIYKACARVAVFVFVIMGIVTMTVLSVDALRLPVLNFILGRSEEYSSVGFQEQIIQNQLQADDVLIMLESNLPEEYRLVQQYVAPDGIMSIGFQNNSGFVVTLDSYESTGIQNIDTEDTAQTIVQLLNYDAVFTDRDGYHILWANEEKQMVYDLFSDGMDKNTFWELATAIAEWTQ